MNVLSTRPLLLVVLAFLGIAPFAMAQPTPLASSSLAKANAGTVGIISGGVDGTYVRIAADLAAVLDDGQTLRVLPVLGKGSLQNVADILYLRGIDVGIVQSDVLTYVRQQRLYPGVEQSLQYIAKLYDEEVHVLARKEITRVEDLAGQPVNVDVAGSGTAMTASLVFEALGVSVQTRNFDQSSALERLKQGELAAIVYVSGQPARLFANVTQESGLHFIALPLTSALAATYLPADLTHGSYPALVDDGAPVATVAVGSVMAVFAWQQSNERYAKVSRFIDAFFTKFPELLKPPRHPKWKDVNLAAKVPGWTRFGPAQDALARQVTSVDATGAANGTGNLRRQFDEYVASRGGSARLNDAQMAVMFRQFLDWQDRGRPPR
jgi:TRAP transporter TAXI family solute receptor